MNNYTKPSVKHYGRLTHVTGVVDPSTKADVDEKAGEEGQGSFSLVPS